MTPSTPPTAAATTAIALETAPAVTSPVPTVLSEPLTIPAFHQKALAAMGICLTWKKLSEDQKNAEMKDIRQSFEDFSTLESDFNIMRKLKDFIQRYSKDEYDPARRKLTDLFVSLCSNEQSIEKLYDLSQRFKSIINSEFSDLCFLMSISTRNLLSRINPLNSYLSHDYSCVNAEKKAEPKATTRQTR